MSLSPLSVLYPRKCVLCRSILPKEETDLCCSCRKTAPVFPNAKSTFPFVARWTALWYYKENVRRSIIRYKFHHARYYAPAYGRMLGMKLLQDFPEGFDAVTWVPTGTVRKFFRGYDQAQLLAEAVAKELGYTPVKLLKKVRNTPPQSGINDSAKRRANVLAAYAVTEPQKVAGQRILLLDDVITTGATTSECAKTLQIAGAKEIYCAAVAAASHHKK